MVISTFLNQAISKFFVPVDWILRRLTMRHVLHFLPTILNKNVFLKTSCSLRDPASDLQNVNIRPPNWALNPQIFDFGTKISNSLQQLVFGLGCEKVTELGRECNPNESIKNCVGGRNLTQILSRGHTTWKVMRKSALKDAVIKKEEVEAVGELSKVCKQSVLRCLYLARIGRLDILVRKQTCSSTHQMDNSL